MARPRLETSFARYLMRNQTRCFRRRGTPAYVILTPPRFTDSACPNCELATAFVGRTAIVTLFRQKWDVCLRRLGVLISAFHLGLTQLLSRYITITVTMVRCARLKT